MQLLIPRSWHCCGVDEISMVVTKTELALPINGTRPTHVVVKASAVQDVKATLIGCIAFVKSKPPEKGNRQR